MDWMRKIEKKGKGILKMKASAIIAPDRIFGDVFSLYQISLDKYLDSIIIAAFAHFHPLLALVSPCWHKSFFLDSLFYDVMATLLSKVCPFLTAITFPSLPFYHMQDCMRCLLWPLKSGQQFPQLGESSSQWDLKIQCKNQRLEYQSWNWVFPWDLKWKIRRTMKAFRKSF